MQPQSESSVRDAQHVESNYSPPRQHLFVTLVHGTVLLARWPWLFRVVRAIGGVFKSREPIKPLWHHADSDFAKSLRKSLGVDRTEIRSFDWTGGNTVWDRLSAAGAVGESATGGLAATKAGTPVTLCEHIAAIARDHPAALQILVGHSHGGSVCLAALSDDNTRARVTAFVSLATPYLHVRKRVDSQNVETALTILGFLLYMAVILVSMWLLERWVGENWNAVVFTLIFFAATGVGATIWNRQQKRIATVHAWSRSFSEPAEGGPARLVVISDGDEALLALKITEALSGISRGLWRAAYGIVELVERGVSALRRRGWIVYLCLSVVLLAFLLLKDTTSPLGPNRVPWTLWFPLKAVGAALVAPLFLFVGIAFALFVPTLVALLLGFPFLVFFRWLAFGWGGSPGLDVTAESLPLGKVAAVRLTAPDDARGLRHAELYNDSRVPTLIADFTAQFWTLR